MDISITWNYMYAAFTAFDKKHHIDGMKVGLQAEEAKPAMSGAGLCPGYTISRAILADAVALTRGDRFLTVDFTRTPIHSRSKPLHC